MVLLTRYLGEELVEHFMGPTPKEFIESRPIRGGGTAKYVPGPRFIQRLNECFGFLWSQKVKKYFEIDGQVVSLVELSVKVPGRTMIREYPDGTKETTIIEGLEIIKEQFGGSEVKKYAKDIKGKDGEITYHKGDVIDLADDYKGATTDAFKKCGMSLGMFSDVYSVRGKQDEGISTAQVEALHMRGEEAGMSEVEVDNWVVERTGRRVQDCEALELMSLIPSLIEMAKVRNGA